MNKLAKKFKIGIALVLMLCLSFCFVPALGGVFADDEALKLSISDVLSKEEFKAQEITNKLPFNPTFEGDLATDREKGWQTAGELTTGNSTVSADMSLEDEIADMDGVKYSDIGASEGKYAMLLICKKNGEDSKGGIAAIESKELINIPARSLYLLTIKVKLTGLKKSTGLYISLNEVNGNIAENNLKEIEIVGIKSTIEKDSEGKDQTVYATYGLLIKGSELYDTAARLQISLGHKEGEDEEVKGEIGIAAIDDIKMFSLSAEQATALKGASNLTNANFSNINSNIPLKVKNGAFNTAIGQGYNLNDVKLFTPANFTQTTSLNNPEATWGIVNTNSAYFDTRFPGVLNPGLTTYQKSEDITKAYNNVLMINNNSNTHQKIASDIIKAYANQVYEFTFEFCTPATKDNFADETNSVSFYLKQGENVIYSQENVFSYAEADHEKDTAKWQRLSLILETAAKEKDLTFEIVFGTEDEAKSGTVYVDNVKLEVRNAEKAFDNIYEDTLEVKDSDPVEYLEKGMVSLEDVKNLKENNIVKTYAFEDKADTEATDKPSEDKKEDETTETSPTTDLTSLIYIIPSVLLAVCLMVGLVFYYVKKIKITPRKKKAKKQNYDRNKTLKIHIEKKEEKKAKQVKLEPKVQKSKTKQEQIADLEKAYNNKEISLDKYLNQREKLEAEIMYVEDLMNE